MEELLYVLTQYFVSCVHVLFYFSLALIYTLLTAPFWPLAILIFSPSLWIFSFSSYEIRLPRSSSFSVIHVSVNINNNVEKDTTLLLFFLSKSPGGQAISFQIKPWIAFVIWLNPWASKLKRILRSDWLPVSGEQNGPIISRLFPARKNSLFSSRSIKNAVKNLVNIQSSRPNKLGL